LDFFVARIAEWEKERSQDPEAQSSGRSGIRILDIGCGKGNVSLPLSQLGYQATGVDYDGPSIEEATKTADELGLSARFIHGSLEQVSSETFDVIVASEVLEHQKDPASFLRILSERLAPGGLLLLSVPNGKSLEERIRKFTTHTSIGRSVKHAIKRRIGHEDVQSLASHPHEQFFSRSSLANVLITNGWRIEVIDGAAAWFKEFYYLFGRLFMKRGSSTFHTLDSADAWLAPHLPLPMADGWLIEARPFDVSKTRVVQVVPTFASGGAERVVFELARRLPAAGFDVHVVALFAGGPLEPLFREAGIRTTVLPRGAIRWWSALLMLTDLFVRERPQIVHTHLFGADVLGASAAHWARVPIVLSTEHNVNVNHGALKRFVKRVLSAFVTGYAAVSTEAKTYMIAAEHIPADHVRVVPNGIDLTRVIPRSPGPFHDIPKLVVIGRLTMQKGHDVLFKALALLKRPWALDIVGTGEREVELKALAERLEISSRIRWLGFRSDVPELLAQSDVFCFPSRWEGLGLAFLEAAAAGVPIVASDLPVFHEILDADRVSYVAPGDVPAFSHALASLLQDPTPAVRRAYEAALDIHTRFSIDAMVADYAEYYKYLLVAKQSSRKKRV
jgi:glycosyltransferase involved in cell wall biosynthesis/2-polyprenyl-3-methyl-5-hydroxy-6-metoxy-1,4-benzoquinol methylase